MFGGTERLDIMNAAFLNGISSHVFDFDDTDLLTAVHPSAPVVPTVLAMAEYRKSSAYPDSTALIVMLGGSMVEFHSLWSSPRLMFRLAMSWSDTARPTSSAVFVSTEIMGSPAASAAGVDLCLPILLSPACTCRAVCWRWTHADQVRAEARKDQDNAREAGPD